MYNPEEKRIDNARKNLQRGFVQTRKEILESNLSEEEKKEAIESSLERVNQAIDILNSVRNIDEIPEEDRESLGIDTDFAEVVVDENVVNTLVEIYAQKAKEKEDKPLFITDEEPTIPEEEIDTTQFEAELRKYFTKHYSDLLDTGFNNFLSDFAEQEDDICHRENGELVEIAQKCNIDSKKFNCFGYKLTVQDGLVAEEDSTFGRAKVYYATPNGINDRITDIYNFITYREANDNDRFITDDKRKLKNTYVKYAEEHGIEIEDKDVLEEIQVDSAKVQAIAKYINRVLNDRDGVEQSDNTALFAEEITRNYSKIMNLQWYNFSDLESVKSVVGENAFIDALYLNIEEDCITYTNEFRPDIVYGTPEYLAKQYAHVMEKVKSLHSSNAFVDGKFDVLKANKEKQALRRYIQENEIEGIDISIPKVQIDYVKTDKVANALMEQYGAEYENKEAMKARILAKVEQNWPEIMTEYQCMDVNDLLKDELKEMGHTHAMESLYVKEDFIYLGDFSNFNAKCIYATQGALEDNIAALDNKIASRDLCFEEERARKVLEQYAQEDGMHLNIPDVEAVKAKRRQEKERFSFGRFGRDFMPDDPTARKQIELNDTVLDTIVKMSEGVPGAIVGLSALLKADKTGGMLLLGLDDMNIRGSQVWEAYKYLYHENAERFADAVSKRDAKMVDFINQEMASVGEEKAVTGGASFDRNKMPDKYRFTEEEVEELRKQRDERREKERKQREKMLANSPAKKNRGAKKRAEREAKKQAYRERLISMGKRSIGELDEELTGLKEKEQQAKKLCEQYEEQLPKKPHQEEL